MKPKYEEGAEVWLIDVTIQKHKIKGIDIDCGVPKYWLDGMFGYYQEGDLYPTKNEVIDDTIEILERHKDKVIRIERRKCPKCGSDYSNCGAIRGTENPNINEWIMVCNNPKCDHESIIPAHSLPGIE